MLEQLAGDRRNARIVERSPAVHPGSDVVDQRVGFTALSRHVEVQGEGFYVGVSGATALTTDRRRDE